MAILFLLALAVLYMVPTLIAVNTGHRNTTAIAVVNILTGWTFVGWVVALVWSVKKD